MIIPLQPAQHNGVGQSQTFIFLDGDGNPVDLSPVGVVLTGSMADRANQLRPITGSLVVGPNPAIGEVVWTYGAEDVAAVGQFLCQFTAGGTLNVLSSPGNIVVGDLAFTYDIGTPRGQVRLHLGDAVLNAGPFPGNFNFVDSEIDYFLSATSSTITGAVVLGLITLANTWASYSVSEWVMLSQQKFDAKQVSKSFREAADFLQENPIEGLGQGRYGVIDLLRDDAYTDGVRVIPKVQTIDRIRVS